MKLLELLLLELLLKRVGFAFSVEPLNMTVLLEPLNMT
jgi:hypothetical protein